ncbi:hypothetical protein [Streptomyces albipurpureus]|uniref:Uncharacterized protein n=1 Tax=Streptomyces albipurpureus TaxID=2897419 RepID=A0ABT0UJ66_9ACTN|nr:hypothetical protein [Streptomyces sp. CWNU-1]MCM2388381.1 hypothetical protein [Streptomyces sp. CWNU-1]
MGLKVSLDFDGVLTNHGELDLRGINPHVFFRSPRSVAAAGPRPGVRQLAALLDCFADVVILTARPPGHRPAIRQWLAQHIPELGECTIFSSGDRPKAAVAEELAIALHVDDDPMAVADDARILLWRREDPARIMTAAVDRLNRLIETGTATRVEDAARILPVGVSSATPVFRVLLRSRRSLKIRVFDSTERAALVERFHREAPSEDDGVRVPGVVSSASLTMTTPWIDGDMVRDIGESERESLIPRAARFLAALHARGPQDSESARLISCAMDVFNLCRTPDGILHLIDAGDCTTGSRWLDVMWAEQLLCASEGEREKLVTCYIKEAGHCPTASEAREAAAEYYGYLHSILINSKRLHNGSASAWRRCDEIARLRRRPVTASALITRAQGLLP